MSDKAMDLAERWRAAIAEALQPLMGAGKIVAIELVAVVDSGQGVAVPLVVEVALDQQALEIMEDFKARGPRRRMPDLALQAKKSN